MPYFLNIPPLHEDGEAFAFWQRRPGREHGDQDGNLIYNAVGVALSSWDSVECTFSDFFGIMVGSRSEAATRAYGTIISNGGKISAIAAAAEISFHYWKVDKEHKDAFALLLAHFGAASSIRNDIAHASVTTFTTGVKERGAFLTPTSHMTSRIVPSHKRDLTQWENLDTFGHKYRFTSADILEWSEKFKRLFGWSISFRQSFGLKYLGDQQAAVALAPAQNGDG